MSSSLEEKVNGRLLANVHGRWTRGHSAPWLLSVPVRQTFRFAGRAGIPIDLSNRQTAEFPGKARIMYKLSLIKSLVRWMKMSMVDYQQMCISGGREIILPCGYGHCAR